MSGYVKYTIDGCPTCEKEFTIHVKEGEDETPRFCPFCGAALMAEEDEEV